MNLLVGEARTRSSTKVNRYPIKDHGYESTVVPLYGQTLRILDFSRFMKGLRPMMETRLDARLLRGLRFEQSGPLLGGQGGDRYTIVRGRERLEVDGAAMTCLVLGNPNSGAGTVHATGALEEVISTLFHCHPSCRG